MGVTLKRLKERIFSQCVCVYGGGGVGGGFFPIRGAPNKKGGGK